MECEKCKGTEKTTQRSDEEKKNLIKRLNIVEGQVRGIKDMGENGRSCKEILTQLSAVQSAVKQVAKLVMLDHLEHCVVENIQDGDIDLDRALKDISEVVDQFSKMK